MQRYQIAIYMRLSKEDDRCRKESNSITMQRILLQRYVKDNFSAYDLYEFCDDGYTGTNFERPGMQSMLERVRNAVIDCIIVKDDCAIIELNAESLIKCGFCAVSSIF